MVFKELHADGHPHIYAIIGCDKPYGFAQIHRALQKEDKVMHSYGSSHVYFWSAVIYASVPSLHKAPAEMDADPFHSLGVTLRERLGDMPRGLLSISDIAKSNGLSSTP